MRIVYTLLLILAAPFLLFGLYKSKPGKPPIGKRWREHFGFAPAISSDSPLWLHTVSVGETIAAKPLLLALRKQHPDLPILVTTTTTTGAAIAEKLGHDIEHRYMPIDFAFAVRGFIKRINPRALVIMETELWPNTLATVSGANIPVVVMNARLSERSKSRYQRVPPFLKLLTKNIDHIACQFREDAERFADLGFKPEQLSITGSIKFDLPQFDNQMPDVVSLTEEIAGRPVWIAASTHPGEDDILLQAHKALLDKVPSALMILVPRHPQRFDDVYTQAQHMGFDVVRRSSAERVSPSTQLYLGDTMGEMMKMFAVSDIAFMAGSLIGEKVGGHNLLEPASLAKPLLTGPSYYNFQVIGDQLIEDGACQICSTSDEIATALTAAFNAPQEREQQGLQALSIVESNRGAVGKTLKALAPFIG
ncbi:3-deoxy-D-manno-octulosonic acid transferase [Veronia nyctiphanis]|uniref:3-deoxy-D-manno-octulosonic acid transferase n=1 Tax=Veronia nyctiphanis TaxID=1278244 RepID=A0A4Q0YR15_9GAMM|nr:lipid IV(A) 3-deoxy-D-manno-octulosonic acid transferase [Veronia nyctiphanis]RXJ73522.1 3-deoxy-D-manno-octulosonic acid transferase [Veronia nyctiphanis]